jgi:hypothetical protein
MEFTYTAWFKNTALEQEDQDHEWPACIIIDADTSSDALSWGDHLAKRFSERSATEIFLRSSCEIVDCSVYLDFNSVPRIRYGYEAKDDEIGW